MIDSPMKSCFSVAAFALSFASMQVTAQVGQKPFPKIEGGSADEVRPLSQSKEVWRPAPDQSAGPTCATEVDEVSATAQLIPGYSARDITNYVVSERKRSVSQLCTDASRYVSDSEKFHGTEIAKLSAIIGKYDQDGQRAFRNMIARHRMELCLARARLAECNRSQSAAGPGRPGTPQPSANIAPASPPIASGNSAADEQQLTAQVSNAIALFEKRRADIDMARKGKPKLHKSGSVAHHCLKPQPGGGMLNDCPYAVEYHYCVFRPRKESWAVGLDCEKNQGGAWQVGRGPGTPVLMHLGGGEITYWFACRYGETLQKPDGISPADIEFQDGRGLLGRCAEWGSKRG